MGKRGNGEGDITRAETDSTWPATQSRLPKE